MKSGIELIAQERREQLVIHNRTITYDCKNNREEQLSKAASILCLNEFGCLTEDDIKEDHRPSGWDQTIWDKMVTKSYKERLIIAGAFIASEIDRLNADENDYLLVEDDCAPDAREYFDKEMQQLIGYSLADFKNKGEAFQDDDGYTVGYDLAAYTIEMSASDPHFHLRMKNNDLLNF